MNTFRLTPALWFEKLQAKGYSDLSSVRKAISKAHWPERDRILARRIAQGFFSRPRQVNPEDVQKLTAAGITEKEPRKPLAKVRQAPTTTRLAPVSAESVTTKEALDTAHLIVNRCNEILDMMMKAKAINPNVDVSEIQGVVDNLAMADQLIQAVTQRAFVAFGLTTKEPSTAASVERKGQAILAEISKQVGVNNSTEPPQH